MAIPRHIKQYIQDYLQSSNLGGNDNVQANSINTEDLRNKSFGWGSGTIEDPFAIEDSFDDGEVSPVWHIQYGETSKVTESGGTLSVTPDADGSSFGDGVKSLYHHSGTVTVRAEMEITGAPNGTEGFALVLSADRNWDRPSILQRGGAYISVNADGTVEFETADSDGNSQGYLSSVSSTQGTTGVVYDVRLTYDADSGDFYGLVVGNGERTTMNQAAGDMPNGLFPALTDHDDADFDVNSFDAQADAPIHRLYRSDTIRIAAEEHQVTDAPFNPCFPKEASGVMLDDGTTYMVVACRNGYPGGGSMDLVLMKSDNPAQGYRQISKVTDNTDTNDAPGIYYDGTDLWILHGVNGNNIHARHAPIDSIPSSPSGWTDEGQIISDGRDPKTILNIDGTLHVLFLNDNASPKTVDHVQGDGLLSLGSRTSVWTRESGTYGNGEAFDVNPDGSGGWVASMPHRNLQSGSAGHIGEFVLSSDSLDGPFSEDEPAIFAQPGSLGGDVRDWYNDWLAHFSVVSNESHTGPAVWNGYHIHTFEAGDGSEFRVGTMAVPKFFDGEVGELIDNELSV